MDNQTTLTPEMRRQAIAEILARGMRRLLELTTARENTIPNSIFPSMNPLTNSLVSVAFLGNQSADANGRNQTNRSDK